MNKETLENDVEVRYGHHFVERATQELYKAFHLLNRSLFNNELPEPAITIQNQGNRTRNRLGWCSPDQIWMDEEKTIRKFEICICAEYLNRSVPEILNTLLHDLVHLYCSSNDIQDTSRNGTYHNKRYRLHAERFGLEVEKDKKYGFSITRLQHGTEKLINTFDLDPASFQLRRFSWGEAEEGEEGEEKEKKPKPKKNVWECPGCQKQIKTKWDKLNIICGDCMKHFVKLEDEDEIEPGGEVAETVG